MVGSHDLTLDLLASLLEDPILLSFVVAERRSLGGLLAIKNGICHLAGSHLLDPDTGEYNFPYIRQYLKEIPVRVIHLVNREQGLMVQKGNSKKIKGLKDLQREEVSFINRQKGSEREFFSIISSRPSRSTHVRFVDTKGRIHPHGRCFECGQRMVDAGLGISVRCSRPRSRLHSDWHRTLPTSSSLLSISRATRCRRFFEIIRSRDFKDMSYAWEAMMSQDGEELTGKDH